jgi:hypothetical protein
MVEALQLIHDRDSDKFIVPSSLNREVGFVQLIFMERGDYCNPFP